MHFVIVSERNPAESRDCSYRFKLAQLCLNFQPDFYPADIQSKQFGLLWQPDFDGFDFPSQSVCLFFVFVCLRKQNNRSNN